MRLTPYNKPCDAPHVPPKPARPPFTPFSFCVTVENDNDLASLWARFNMSGEVLGEAAADAAENGKKGAFSNEFVEMISTDLDGKREIWKFLNKKLKERGIQVR